CHGAIICLYRNASTFGHQRRDGPSCRGAYRRPVTMVRPVLLPEAKTTTAPGAARTSREFSATVPSPRSTGIEAVRVAPDHTRPPILPFAGTGPDASTHAAFVGATESSVGSARRP